jgi:hypothetical protein
MIYRTEAFGGIEVRPPRLVKTETGALLVLESREKDMYGNPLVERPLWRGEVERLRDLCDEALA